MEMERKLSGGVFAASVRRERGQESPKQTVRRKPNPAPAGRKNARAGMETAVHLIFLLCGIVAVAFVLFISVYLIVSGLPAIQTIGLKEFLLGEVWAPTASTVRPPITAAIRLSSLLKQSNSCPFHISVSLVRNGRITKLATI